MRVEFTRSALKELAGIPAKDRSRIRQSIEALATDAPGLDVKKLQGATDEYRLRVGDWRVLFVKEADRLIIIIIAVRHRREAYR